MLTPCSLNWSMLLVSKNKICVRYKCISHQVIKQPARILKMGRKLVLSLSHFFRMVSTGGLAHYFKLISTYKETYFST